MPSNDNDRPGPRSAMLPATDAKGHAALILVESLIHGLIARSVITAGESMDIMTAAIEVQADYVAQAPEDDGRMVHAQTLLASIAESLRSDI